MAVLLPRGAFLTEDRLTFTLETAEPLGVSPPEAVDLLLIKEVIFRNPTRRKHAIAAVPSERVSSCPSTFPACIPSTIQAPRQPGGCMLQDTLGAQSPRPATPLWNRSTQHVSSCWNSRGRSLTTAPAT